RPPRDRVPRPGHGQGAPRGPARLRRPDDAVPDVHGERTAGGSLALAELIEQHGEAIAADWARFYNEPHFERSVLRSLLDADGEWTPGEVLVRTKWLPEDSAFRASLAGGPEHIGWSLR